MADAIEELLAVTQRIAHLVRSDQYGAVGKALAIPYAWKRRVEAISISARDGSWAREAKQEDIDAAKAIQKELASRYEEEGKVEMEAALGVIASELEGLRGILPSLAARAAIEAGVEARKISAMRKGGEA